MIQLDSLILPDLVWVDRYGFTGVDSRVEKTLTGRPIIWEQETQGRPIILQGSNDSGWITKTNLETLFAMAQTPSAQFELSYEGSLFTVRFRQEDIPCISADPVIGRPNSASGDYFSNLVIKLMEV